LIFIYENYVVKKREHFAASAYGVLTYAVMWPPSMETCR